MRRSLVRLHRATALLFAAVFLVDAWRGGLDLLFERPLFVLFALVLIFLDSLARAGRLRPADVALVGLAVVTVGYVVLNHATIAYQAGIARGGQVWLAAIALVIILDATRRVVGWALPVLVLAMIAYASMIVFTGIGLKFSALAVEAAGGNPFVILLFVAAATLVLGLALPTTASYLIAAATVAPALESVGIPTLTAHMFIFYYSVLATITPPEGMALFTASAIAGANWLDTGWKGMRLTLSGYLVPFGFVFIPTLLLRGSPADAILHISTAALGVNFLSAAITGYMGGILHPVERAGLAAGAALLFLPSATLSVVGLGLCGVVFARRMWMRQPAPGPGRAPGPAT